MALTRALVLARGAPPGDTELGVVETLKQALKGSPYYRAWASAALFTPSGDRWELDLVVLGHHAVYVLDVKHLTGRITGDERIRAWIEHTRESARLVAKLLKQELDAAHVPVVPLAVLANPEVEIALDPPDRARVVTLSELLHAIQFGDLPGAPLPPDREAIDEATVRAVQRVFNGVRHRVQPGRGSLRQELSLVQRDLVLDFRERTGLGPAGPHRGLLEEAASVWIIASSFGRALEERGFVEPILLAGPGAEQAERAFVEAEPGRTASDYLLQAIESIAAHPAGEAVLGESRELLRRMPLSERGARELLDFFRQRGPSGKLRWSFAGDPWTDMYQHLSDLEREEHGMIGTPVFIDDFLLDRTLEPAVQELGAGATRVMDPACGSGLLLLRAFDRLCGHLRRGSPGADPKVIALEIMDQVYGVDISLAAALVTRIHLALGYFEQAGIKRLAEAPRLPLHIVAADALLAGGDWEHTEGGTQSIFKRRYEVVVSEPPFMTCKDEARREVYRKLYQSAVGKFSLMAPFIERCFQLATEGGFIGIFATNSFANREYGRPLIEKVLSRVDLTQIIDASGAYIPGHGTPTLLLFGRNRPPCSATVSIVAGKRVEPIAPLDPAKGEVWSRIAGHHEDIGYDDDYISVVAIPRASLTQHPWSLRSRPEAALIEIIEQRSSRRLRDLAEGIRPGGSSGVDDVFVLPPDAPERLGIEPEVVRPALTASAIRDWSSAPENAAIAPYDHETGRPLPPDPGARWWRFLWRYRAVLQARSAPGKPLPGSWWAWSTWRPSRRDGLPRLLYPAVGRTFNVVLEHGDAVLNRTVVAVELPAGAAMDDRLALLGYLNSSTAYYWMKQVSFSKGPLTQGTAAEMVYEFAGPARDIPIPKSILEPGPLRALSILLAKQLIEAAGELLACSPARVLEAWDRHSRDSLVEALGDAQMRELSVLRRMVSAQEDLDWVVYEAVGLTDPSLRREAGSALPEQRPFAWLSDEPPAGLDRRLVDLWKRRRDAARASPLLRDLESPSYKRLFQRPTETVAIAADEAEAEDAHNEDTHREQNRGRSSATLPKVSRSQDFRRRTAAACEAWLLDRLEDVFRDLEAPRCLLAGELSVHLADTPGTRDVISLHHGQLSAEKLAALTIALADAHAVAAQAALRHTKRGLEKRAAWEQTWQMQEREDTGEEVRVPVPPKYEARDYRDAVTWRLRGKLNVPRERFVRYSAAAPDRVERLYGWAGWNAEQRALALKALREKGIEVATDEADRA